MKRHQIDCRRLLCPMPVIKVQNAIEELPAGSLVEAICTDPGALNDIPAWSRINGHRLVETRTDDGEYIVVVEVVGE
ncbi:MAG: sulfurtransferase TusA family protein [Candidatus Thiodiazotropha lotti]|uniref:SirA family protein n=1 Tax=Candidatus Thiodiazotropha endoloripes TaxID=1818881 RepID=A0A1E2UMW2_9GAMM|nr:sulfurtransferase TusA family protein [Candidatus Thiodiazotropha endoloripes]MCG7897160.1 sulfurtransferase TusA family protein [Candidatus Thiodiazotropha weberae]MCG7991485.1 sulfurtransferase TusA family protein [Candidatus Thiodiazotropha lotti]MCG7902272.1 sulfurtransferase TusA family protein [Candidatus Thiodiazotropha weberae]MCG7912674.1 sulfurtransferase TusA family protein [Candidatus Thiodiazotropha weberae]MCG8000966.1 sulfurtransferase TusA family protein [Candidatus Thiodiaz